MYPHACSHGCHDCLLSGVFHACTHMPAATAVMPVFRNILIITNPDNRDFKRCEKRLCYSVYSAFYPFFTTTSAAAAASAESFDHCRSSSTVSGPGANSTSNPPSGKYCFFSALTPYHRSIIFATRALCFSQGNRDDSRQYTTEGRVCPRIRGGKPIHFSRVLNYYKIWLNQYKEIQSEALKPLITKNPIRSPETANRKESNPKP